MILRKHPTRFLLTACAFVCIAPVSVKSRGEDSGNRRILSDALAHYRLKTVGSKLAFKTYTAYEKEFVRLGQNEFARIASCFRQLAEHELSGQPSSDARSDVIDRLRALALSAKNPQYEIRLLSNNRPPDNSITGITIHERSNEYTVEYRFFDASFFRHRFNQSIESLKTSSVSENKIDHLLLLLWCHVLEKKWQDARSVRSEMNTELQRATPTERQRQEYQYLLLAIFDGEGQSDDVNQFLERRLENPPSERWAQRALTVLDHSLEDALACLRSAARMHAGGQHPFSRTVLSSSPDRVEQVLDSYWTVAWMLSELGLDSIDQQASGARAESARHASALVSELSSPTVTEPWREQSLLRITTVINSGIRLGDPESWQLSVSEAFIDRHPVLTPIVRMSRDWSGLIRTQETVDAPPGQTDFDGREADDLIAILWGADIDGDDLAFSAAAKANPAPTTRGVPNIWVWLSVIAVTLIVLATVYWKKTYVRAR